VPPARARVGIAASSTSTASSQPSSEWTVVLASTAMEAANQRGRHLIWKFAVDSGRQPTPFDLLYSNSDSTRVPVEVHNFYLRTVYHENRLAKPGGISLAGVPIDLTRIRTPTFMVSTREDHIATVAVDLCGNPGCTAARSSSFSRSPATLPGARVNLRKATG
jgi:poly(3-hydroxyalkanoate) synthetase